MFCKNNYIIGCCLVFLYVIFTIVMLHKYAMMPVKDYTYEDSRVIIGTRRQHGTIQVERQRNIVERETSRVSKYIHIVLEKIKDPEKKKKEHKFLIEYNNTRNRIINMLPCLTKQSLGTTFHVLVDNSKKLKHVTYDMIVVVLSYALHFKQRNTIRQLWGNKTTSINKNWKLFYITGGVINERDMLKLYLESFIHKDVIIEDLMEDFSLNLAKKTMIGLQWANENFKFKYIMKCDDDIYADIDSIISALQKINTDDIYAGCLMEGTDVLREGRYGLSVEEHPANLFDPYCSGGGYIFSKSVVEKIIPLFHWEHPLRIEDAYMGSLVFKVGANATNLLGFDMWNDDCKYSDGLLLTHPSSKACIEYLHDIILGKKLRYI